MSKLGREEAILAIVKKFGDTLELSGHKLPESAIESAKDYLVGQMGVIGELLRDHDCISWTVQEIVVPDASGDAIQVTEIAWVIQVLHLPGGEEVGSNEVL